MRSAQGLLQISACCSSSHTSKFFTNYLSQHRRIFHGGVMAIQRRRLQRASVSWQRRTHQTSAGLRLVESYDASFELAKESHETLEALLSSPVFCKQVPKETQLPEGTCVVYTGMLFQPVPWSPTTKKGMPQEFEQYIDSPDYVFINIPPNFLFKAKIFKPSRLCAIYRKV